MQSSGLELEKSEVEMLLELARETEAAGTDAKAEALLELIYKLQQEEGDPALKVLIFTEFVPTQAMLADFLESRGFSVTTLNGSMDLETRTRAQQAFSKDVRVLISTDAGGEGLNLQFCHVIVNFDMPWNPMRIEQRIGRVDRIGQKHVVRAINFVLEDTVEHRVRQVLEEKLEVIAQEFGVDKAAAPSYPLPSACGICFMPIRPSCSRPGARRQASFKVRRCSRICPSPPGWRPRARCCGWCRTAGTAT
jgi:SNF2 family DNA or RNA helicase